MAEDLGKGEKRGQDGTGWGEGGQVTWMSGERLSGVRDGRVRGVTCACGLENRSA